MSRQRLKEYHGKRDLSRSGEPSGASGTQDGGQGFVIQRHDASSLHFDVRFEVDGVLASWAVPKGPSTDPREKRLATRTEDHPLDYAAFEGVIPEGYGAGSVVVWDVGSYDNLTTDDDGEPVPVAKALERGHLKLGLHGRHLHGTFALTHTRMRGDDRNWLLIKVDDETADRRANPVSSSPESVLTARSNEAVAEAAQQSGREVDIPNPDKPMFPEDDITKSELVHYYESVAEAMLPHLRGRPLALRRYPDGVGSKGFVQQAAGHVPDWVRVESVPRADGEGDVEHIVCDDLSTLRYLAGQAALELHAWTSRVGRLDCPDRLVMDLDPSDGTSVADLRECARRTRKLLVEVGLHGFVQTTGSRGFHVVAPLDTSASFEVVRKLARGVAEALERRHPDDYTTEQRIADRGDRIFLDTGRNAYGQTAVVPYSLRAKPGAPAATPLDWSELGGAEPTGHGLRSLPRRLGQKTDPWALIELCAGCAQPALERLSELSDD